MSFDITNKVALVTGANRGIGKSIVNTLLDNGAAKVYAAVRKIDSAQPLVDEYGDKVCPVEVDMTKPETIVAAAKQASDVELVINNAGVLTNASPLSPEAYDHLLQEIDVNVGGLLRMVQAFAPVLKNNKGGAFVQLNSVASMKSFADFSTYCASKAAAYSITQALKEKLEEQGTLVVSVHPGPIKTDMAATAGLGDMGEPPVVVAEAIIDALKAGKFHCFPDSMAKQIAEPYQPFAKNIVEVKLMED